MSLDLPIISVNGIEGASISPLDRGFAYGDGMFETCRYENGRIPLWSYHLERLLYSADRLKIKINELQLQHYLNQILQQPCIPNNAVIKVQITRGVGGRGYRLPVDESPTYCIGLFSGDSLDSDAFRKGVDVRVCDLRLSKNPLLAGIKHLNRLEHILARSEWQGEFAEGLLLDVDDYLVEATISNVFIIKDRELLTPDLSFSGVAGVMRRVIIEIIAPRLNLPVNVKKISIKELTVADELFLSNSVFGVWPVNNIDGFSKHLTHEITHQIQKTLIELLYAEKISF